MTQDKVQEIRCYNEQLKAIQKVFRGLNVWNESNKT